MDLHLSLYCNSDTIKKIQDVVVETKNIQANQTHCLDHCREQIYTSINDKTIDLIILIQFIVTQKQLYCFPEMIYDFSHAEQY